MACSSPYVYEVLIATTTPTRNEHELEIVFDGRSVSGLNNFGGLTTLEEEIIRPNIVTDTSAGSNVVALYESGMSLNEMESTINEIGRSDASNFVISPRGGSTFSSHLNGLILKLNMMT